MNWKDIALECGGIISTEESLLTVQFGKSSYGNCLQSLGYFADFCKANNVELPTILFEYVGGFIAIAPGYQYASLGNCLYSS